MKTLLITGGAGFIGANFIHFLLETHPDLAIYNLDVLTYAGNLENLKSIENHPNYHFIKGSICDASLLRAAFKNVTLDAIVHFAAESHVDRSILGSTAFVETNVLGTHVLLEFAKERAISRFVHVSTDEVYGTLGPDGAFTEETPIDPSSPYSSSKAASDLIALSFFKTFGLPVIVTRCSNNYGPYQFPEKLIPLMITNALEDRPLPVYGKGENIRDWIHVKDHCRGVYDVLTKGEVGQIYNLGGDSEVRNIDVVKKILTLLGKPDSLIQFVTDRLGHDFRYAMDHTKVTNALGWTPAYSFEQGLEETVKWYLGNKLWWQRVKSGDYQSYYQTQYENR